MVPVNIHAQSESGEAEEDFSADLPLKEDFEFHTINADGSVSIVPVEDGSKAKAPKSRSIETRAITNGVVNFKTKGCDTNTIYYDEVSNRKGYVNGCYGTDGAYLGTSGNKVRFMQAGVIGLVDASDVEILDYDTSTVQSVNFYRAEQGRIYHYITTDIKVNKYPARLDNGPQQSYMDSNKVYYSYDGHYFYSSYADMISDYKNGTRAKSINADAPYYNYYQYLSQRTKSNISASSFDITTKDTVGSNTKMAGLGSAFISAQNTYGANALLSYSTAANESEWGKSNIANTKNNLFGHAAYDSDPNNANAYKTPADSVNAHAKVFVSINYLDPLDGFDNYQGPHLGDKQNGMNVRYAADAYWGEKNAAVAYAVDRATGGKDYGRYTIGMVEAASVSVRKEATTSSKSLYKTNDVGMVPVIILGEVTGESVNGNTKWYKVQSDGTLNADRTAVTQDIGNYDYAKDYGYISAAYVDIIYKGSYNYPTEPENPSGGTDYKKGDVNGDGKITASDYVLIKNHIMGKSTLEGAALKAADYDNNGKTTASDYVLVKNYIMGR